jgi:hypothetical protein
MALGFTPTPLWLIAESTPCPVYPVMGYVAHIMHQNTILSYIISMVILDFEVVDVDRLFASFKPYALDCRKPAAMQT